MILAIVILIIASLSCLLSFRYAIAMRKERLKAQKEVDAFIKDELEYFDGLILETTIIKAQRDKMKKKLQKRFGFKFK